MEIECPVCDCRITVDAKKCPECGADFTSLGMDDLEAVAERLSNPEIIEYETEEPPAQTVVTSPAAVLPEKAAEKPEAIEAEQERKEEKGLFRRFLKKK